MCIDKRKFVIGNVAVREFLAEFLATLILIVCGLASNAQFVLGRGQYGTIHTVFWGWGIAVAIAIYTSIGVSGGHINPAITVSFAVVGKVPWRKVPHYLFAHYLAAFVGSAIIYAIYMDALDAFDGGIREITGPNATAGIWATYPHPDVSIVTCFFDQVLGTFLLLFGVSVIIDPRNGDIPYGLRPFMIGILVFMLGTSMAFNCGGAINPARDLMPRVFTWIAGWGSGVLVYRNYFFWVPIVGPHVGGALGAMTYVGLIELHWPEVKQSEDKGFEVKVKNKTPASED